MVVNPYRFGVRYGPLDLIRAAHIKGYLFDRGIFDKEPLTLCKINPPSRLLYQGFKMGP
jgi:hypothetical protein